MNFSKVYNATTGILTLNRTSITGAGFIIQFTANIYASFQPVLVGNVTGAYSTTIDCTGVTDWQSRTADDFIMDIIWIDLPSEITGTMYFTKSYNPSTGKLTINRSSIIGNGTVTFNANIYTTRYPSQVTSLSNANLTITSNDESDTSILNNNLNILNKEEIEISTDNTIETTNTINSNDILENKITTSSTVELIENIIN